MATEFATGVLSITTGAAGSTVVVSGLSFQPKMLWLWWSGQTSTTDAGGSATYNRGFGVATSATEFWAQSNRYTDALGTSDAEIGIRSDACVLELTTDAASGWADLQSFDSGGFTLEILDAFTANLRVSWAAFGGSDITNATAGVFTATGTAPTTQTVSALGFIPTGLLLATVAAGTSPPFAADAHAQLSIGVCTSTSDEHVLLSAAQDAAGTGDGGNYALAGELLACSSSSGSSTASPTCRADLNAFGSGGANNFVINWLERGVGVRIGYCTWKGGNFVVGDLLTQTDTTTPIVESGLGFQPNGVVFFSGGNAAVTADAALSVHDEWSIGAASSASNRAAQAACSRDGNTNMFAQTFIEHDEVYINVDPTTDAIEGLMDVQSFDSDGFTCIMDDADPAQAFVWYVAVGNPPTAAAWIPPRDAPPSAGQRMRLRR